MPGSNDHIGAKAMKKSRPIGSSSAPKAGKKRQGSLTQEDHRLWRQVAATVKPLSEEKGQFLKDEMNRLMDASAVPDRSAQPTKKQKPLDFKTEWPRPNPSKSPVSHPIEDRIVKNIGKGRQAIDARIDLHGMTQDRARFALLDFLQMAQQANYRMVLVITGKGNQGRGVLRANVPRWLSLPAFAQLVNGYRESEAPHGGGGALYVRIRRRPTNGLGSS
jgi:DNA-nicking Smr family endonuclease